MRTPLTRLRAALVLLLVSSGLLFAIGSTIERHQHHSEPHPSAAASTESSSGVTGNESGSGESATHVEQGKGEAGAKILGVNTESVALMIVAVVASLLLALAVWLGRWPRPLLLLVVGFGLVFAAGDGRELVHQLNESNAGIAAIAAILIGLHLAVAALAATLFLRPADADTRSVAEPAT